MFPREIVERTTGQARKDHDRDRRTRAVGNERNQRLEARRIIHIKVQDDTIHFRRPAGDQRPLPGCRP